MKTTAVLVFAALCALSALSLADDKNGAKPSVTVSPAEEFDKQNTTTKPPTPKPPITTAPQPTTKPPKPTTKPTTKPPKPTTKPTTKPPKPTTKPPKPTTKPPKPTTKATTTPAPKPTPTPSTNASAGNYTLMQDKAICLMAVMALQVRLSTPQANATFTVQPNKTTTSGFCTDPKANLTLGFTEGFITFMFNKNSTDNMVYVNALSFDISYTSSNRKTQLVAKNETVRLFAAKVGNSYSCKTESIYMGKGLYLDVTQDKMQAFNLTKSNEFGRPDLCAADQPDYRVAIAVGVTLLVLIVIVVVAYLLGRRRRTDGYQSL